jgi:nucleoside-diphosphate-sugar epimerase
MPPAESSLLSVLIIGGENTIGRAVLRCLRPRYRDIVVSVLDLMPIDFELYPRQTFCEFDFFPCNVGDSSELANVLLDVRPEVIIDCARRFSEQRGSANQSTCSSPQIDLDGTRNFLSAAKEAGVKALVYMNSAGIAVGDSSTDYINVDEQHSLPNSIDNSWNESLLSAERLVLSALSSSFRATVVRPATMVDSSPAGIIARVLKRHASPFIQPLSNSEELLDFASVDNVALALILAAENLVRNTSEANGQVIFISDCSPISVQEFEEAVVSECGTPTSVQYSLLITGARTFNYNLAREVLGYKPAVSLREGIRRAATVSYNERLE